mgnify:CR=1 FL=1
MSYEHEREPQVRPLPTKSYCRSLPPRDEGLVRQMEAYLEGRGLNYRLAVANMWYPSSQAGDNSPRIVMPATSNIRGNTFWQARAMDGSEKRYQSPPAARGDAVILVWPERPMVDRAVVSEGPMDALAAAGEGWLGIALMGNTPPDETLLLTKQFLRGIMATIIVPDMDDPTALTEVMSRLVQLGVPNCRLVLPYPKKDLSDCPRELRSNLLNS